MLTIILAALSAIGSLATAAGVWFTRQQLKDNRDQSTTSFEDSLSREYRGIALALPLEALFDEDLGPSVQAEFLKHFYNYFDLCNEQIFLTIQGRICQITWENWAGGIRSNMERRAFIKAWTEIKDRAGSDFCELRLFEEDEFRGNPKGWPSNRIANLKAALDRQSKAAEA